MNEKIVRRSDVDQVWLSDSKRGPMLMLHTGLGAIYGFVLTPEALEQLKVLVLEHNEASESALDDVPEPISGADGAAGKPGADSDE